MNPKSTRKPKQERSIVRRNKILDAAYNLFCDKGFFNTTTNEIASNAEVQISSLYSYFNDKDDILMVLLEKYNSSFLEKFSIYSDLQIKIETIEDIEKIVLNVLDILINLHLQSKEFNKELNALYFYKPEVAELMNAQEKKIQSVFLNLFNQVNKLIKVSDLEVASVVCFNLISSTVDTIVFKKNLVEHNRLMDGCAKAIVKYLK